MPEAARIIPFQTELGIPGEPDSHRGLPEQCARLPEFRYMGSKRRLLPWIHSVVDEIDFESAWDPFSGASSVGYLLKASGRRVVASDFLNFSTTIARALIENPGKTLDGKAVAKLFEPAPDAHDFIERTFSGVFYEPEDLRFLDRISGSIRQIEDPHLQSLAMAALFRSCLKKQPRGVFTISGDLSKYDDGRRDLRLSIREHFLEQVEAFNQAAFSNGRRNRAMRGDVFELSRPSKVDLVYFDPPYVPRSDDNCYIKRYHFLEGLSCYWQGLQILEQTKVKKIPKRFTPFSYRKSAEDAFDRMFQRHSDSKLVLSYSSNAFPNLDTLVGLMERYKKRVEVHSIAHRYHFGNHAQVKRAAATEYLVVGQ